MTLTRRQVFDTVKKHLLAQEVPSLIIESDGGRTCLYRGPNGTKCAVGCLIPDDLYCFALENLTVYDKLVKDVLRAAGVDINNDLEVLGELQDMHDNDYSENWKWQLDEIEAWYLGVQL